MYFGVRNMKHVVCPVCGLNMEKTNRGLSVGFARTVLAFIYFRFLRAFLIEIRWEIWAEEGVSS